MCCAGGGAGRGRGEEGGLPMVNCKTIRGRKGGTSCPAVELVGLGWRIEDSGG